MLLSGGCVAVVIYLDDNVTVRWVCCRIIIFYSVCVCVCVWKLRKLQAQGNRMILWQKG